MKIILELKGRGKIELQDHYKIAMYRRDQGAYFFTNGEETGPMWEIPQDDILSFVLEDNPDPEGLAAYKKDDLYKLKLHNRYLNRLRDAQISTVQDLVKIFKTDELTLKSYELFKHLIRLKNGRFFSGEISYMMIRDRVLELGLLEKNHDDSL